MGFEPTRLLHPSIGILCPSVFKTVALSHSATLPVQSAHTTLKPTRHDFRESAIIRSISSRHIADIDSGGGNPQTSCIYIGVYAPASSLKTACATSNILWPIMMSGTTQKLLIYVTITMHHNVTGGSLSLPARAGSHSPAHMAPPCGILHRELLRQNLPKNSFN